MDVLVRDSRVRPLAVLGVDLEGPAQPYRETPQEYHRRQPTGVAVERRAGRRPALARRDPLGVDAGRMGVLRLLRWRRGPPRDPPLGGRGQVGGVTLRPRGGVCPALRPPPPPPPVPRPPPP